MSEINKLIHENIFGAKWYRASDRTLIKAPHLKNLKWLYTDSEVETMLRQNWCVLAIGSEVEDEVEGITKYSGSIAEAFKVVDECKREWKEQNSKRYWSFIDRGDSWRVYIDNDQETICREDSTTLPMAICLAALSAKGIEFEGNQN